ncbi:MAG: glycosyltransferase family 4 protein, partial [Chitinivibrionales bacterium]|nr:glycosyltransferase family 4 protein [Chitinivibrionales bacterium]
YVIKVIRTLIAINHEITVFHGHQEPLDPIEGTKGWFAFPDLFGKNYRNNRSTFKMAKSTLASVNPDLIYIHQVHNPKLIAYLAGRWPTVRFEHDIDLTCPSGRRMSRDLSFVCNRKPGWICQWYAFTRHCMPRNLILGLKRIRQMNQNFAAHQKIRRIRVASSFVKELLVKQGFSPDRIAVFPYFTEIPRQVSRSVNWEKPNVLFVGRAIPEKGPQRLLEALKKIKKPLSVSFLGSGDLLPQLKAMAHDADWPHEVQFFGWIDNAQTSVFYQKAALLVVPSLTEPFGIIGIEAMAHAIPVVAFNVGGISDWLRHGKTGLLVARNNIDSLAEAIERLAFDKPLNIEFGEQGRRIAEKEYSLELHTGRLLALFNDVLQNPGKI